MKEFLIEMERIIKREIKTAHDNLREELRTELRTEFRTELKTEINGLRAEFKTEINELRTEFKTEIDELRTEFKTDINELKGEVKELRKDHEELKEVVYLMQYEHGKKLDAIFDYITLDKQKEKKQNQKNNNLEKIAQENQLKIWNLENRVEVLEECFNS